MQITTILPQWNIAVRSISPESLSSSRVIPVHESYEIIPSFKFIKLFQNHYRYNNIIFLKIVIHLKSWAEHLCQL